ncbi:MAG: DUF1080 domain-containing protein, partial [Rhodopirellula sp.]|nr:DUF1080 domain-containing protein [Rhodopirellula sp.]
MRSPRLVVFVASICLLAVGASAKAGLNELTEAESRSGWKLLFDGKSTKGWRNYKKDSVSDGWKIEDGVLSRVGKGAGDII